MGRHRRAHESSSKPSASPPGSASLQGPKPVNKITSPPDLPGRSKPDPSVNLAAGFPESSGLNNKAGDSKPVPTVPPRGRRPERPPLSHLGRFFAGPYRCPRYSVYSPIPSTSVCTRLTGKLKPKLLAPPSLSLAGWGPEICHCNKLPGGVHAGVRTRKTRLSWSPGSLDCNLSLRSSALHQREQCLPPGFSLQYTPNKRVCVCITCIFTCGGTHVLICA